MALHACEIDDPVCCRFPNALFCVENTASMSKEMKTMMANLLGVAAIELDSADFGAAVRRRQYWLNYGPLCPLQPFQHRKVPLGKLDPTLGKTMYKLPTILTKGTKKAGYQRPLSIEQLEACNTIPKGATQLKGRCQGQLTDSERLKLIGQCAPPAVLAHLLFNIAVNEGCSPNPWAWTDTHSLVTNPSEITAISPLAFNAKQPKAPQTRGKKRQKIRKA